jgi:ParB-like chromosome segregation protein Spo0J
LSINAISREFKDLPLAALDRPELDARIERSPEFLEALTVSIRRDGVLVPLIVVRVGERYEVVDGFTRYIAPRAPAWPSCRVASIRTRKPRSKV